MGPLDEGARRFETAPGAVHRCAAHGSTAFRFAQITSNERPGLTFFAGQEVARFPMHGSPFSGVVRDDLVAVEVLALVVPQLQLVNGFAVAR